MANPCQNAILIRILDLYLKNDLHHTTLFSDLRLSIALLLVLPELVQQSKARRRRRRRARAAPWGEWWREERRASHSQAAAAATVRKQSDSLSQRQHTHPPRGNSGTCP